MSDFHVEVVRIGKIGKHPNADSLSITHAMGNPCIIKTGDFQPGDLAVYIPVDAIVPVADPRFAFLKKGEATEARIKAVRLRNIFSMGLLVRASEGMQEGQNVQAEMGIGKYEPLVHGIFMSGENEPEIGVMPGYTDLESLRRHSTILQEGEHVICTEKIHGANARYCFTGGRLAVGSHHRVKVFDEKNMWWRAAIAYDLEKKLAHFPDVAFYGEVYGQVQDLKYGAGQDEINLRFFDARDGRTGAYFDHYVFTAVMKYLDLPTVPVLYDGPWSESVLDLRNGRSTVGGDHTREGFVVRPLKERTDHCGRVILKMVGEDYLLRKEAA